MDEQRKSPEQMLLQDFAGVASCEVNECSVVASDANYKVEQIFKEKGNTSELGRVLSGGPSFRRPVYFLDEKDLKHHRSARVIEAEQPEMDIGEKVKLAFIKPYRKEEKLVEKQQPQPEPEQRRRLHIGRKAVQDSVAEPEYEIVEEEVEEDALFGATLDNDLFLPLGSFRYRPNSGACSFIQLGPEMRDGDYYVSPNDETGWRHRVVEAIRGLLEGESYSEDSAEYVELRKFMVSEFGRYEQDLAEKKEAQFVRRCFDELAIKRRNYTPAEYQVIQEDEGTFDSEQLYVRSISPDVVLQDGRRVSLMLGGGEDESQATLFVNTRSKLCLPIMGMSSKTGSVTYHGGVELDEAARANNVELLKNLTTGGRFVPDLNDTPEAYDYNVDELSDLDFYIANRLSLELNNQPIGEGEYKSLEGKKTEFTQVDAAGRVLRHTDRGDEVAKLLKKYIDDPWRIDNPFPDSLPLKLSEYRTQTVAQRYVDLIEDFDADTRISEALGETDPCQEALMEKIVHLGDDKEFSATIEDMPTATSRGTFVFNVKTELEGTNGQLTIISRPIGMGKDGEFVYCDIAFDTTQALLANHETRMPDSDYALTKLMCIRKVEQRASFK